MSDSYQATASTDRDYLDDLWRRTQAGQRTTAEVGRALRVLASVVDAWAREGSFPGSVCVELANWRKERGK